ncbi:D-galactonate dehydratase family protein [Altererythrobacter aurantiacus]|uniref:mannonate dehydratase n=1 Tax=Parapontixanthobacter aurantiacus TaxID=1463599 RepID=A0A844ZDJ5_9SPHN|nr:D-mannonate dehydratase ManD [Parapontixanthobacter aurantiacus]MXO85838.1 D-galactonate dehydratase family protein [Parapontixanthobacter aurantiacus]
MKITTARVIVCSPGRNFVTLKIETDQGVYGIGDATLNGRELSVVTYLEEHVIPCLIGRDPQRIEDIWQFLYRGSYWRRGPVQMSAVSAVDTALWDIKAKMAGMPLYQLLGGRSRERVLVYGHANGETLEDTVEAVGHYIDMGYKAIRAQSGIPGIEKAYGIARGTMHYEPADAALPTETVWDTSKYLRFAPKLFEALRKEFGDEPELLHDVHHRLTPNEAAQLGKALEPCRLFWMEDPTPAENQQAFRLIRERTTTPIAVGEIFHTIWDAKELIENQLVDYVRTTVLRAGGITHLRRIADLASLYQVRTGSHGATDLSPVTMGAALHFDTWVPNFGIQEYMRHSDETDAVFPHDYRFEKGFLLCGETPGHGVDVDEKLVAQYPYKPAQLPVARLEDGTIWNW